MMETDAVRHHHRLRQRVVLLYWLLGSAWVLATDWGLAPTASEVSFNLLQSVKGLFFISASGVLLYVLMGGMIRRIQTFERRISDQADMYRRLFDAFQMPTLVTTVDGKAVLAANEAAAALLGYGAGELVGFRVADLLIPPGEPLPDGADGYPQYHGFNLVRRRDGSTVRVNPARSEMHFRETPAVLLLLPPVPEHRLAEEALLESERKLRIMADNSRDMIYCFRFGDPPAFEYVSPSCRDLTGYTVEELQRDATLVFNLLSPEDLQFFTELIQNPEAREREVVVRFHRKGGGAIWTHQRIRFLRDEAGKALYSEGIVRDITEQAAAEAALRESEERHRLLIEQASDGILVLDKEGRILQFSEQARRLFGYAEEDFGAVGFRTLLVHPPRTREECFILNLRRGEVVRREVAFRRKDGSAFTADISATLLSNDLAQVIVRDATERKRYEQGLIEARERADETNRLKDTFLANISHEIRTPLTSILGFSEVLREQAKPENLEYVNLIVKGGERLMSTLNALLDLAQLRGGTFRLHPLPFDPAAEVRQSLLAYEQEARQKGIALGLEVGADAPLLISADPNAFRRIVSHLVSNAVKFTDAGSVRVHLSGQADRLRLSVQDTGIGIGKPYLDRLFEEFSQESSGLDRHFEGMGLGLSIASQLVALMGGSLEAASEPGAGAAFTVLLPCGQIADDAEEIPEAAAEEAGPAMLLVDDDPNMRHLVPRMLHTWRRIDVAADAEAGLALAAEGRYEVVLLDINLGDGQTGADVLRGLRTLPGYDRIPIVALTAFALPGDAERFLEEGFTEYLSKPFSKSQLLETISKARRAA